MRPLKILLGILILLNLNLLQAQEARHLVPVEDLHGQLKAQSLQRTENIQEIRALLQHGLVQQRLGGFVDMEKVEVALAAIDEETLELLAEESREVNDQLEAGLATSTWIIIAVAVAAAAIFFIWWADAASKS